MGIFDKAGDALDILPGVDLGKLRNLVDLLWDHRDDLVDLVTRLPGLLGDAGESMHAAGTGAESAAGLLSGDLLTLTGSAADALAACHDQLATVASVLGEIGDVIDKVPLMGDVAAPVTKGLQAVRTVSDRLDEVGGQVRGIGSGLSSVGEGLGSMGGSLRSGGAALAALSGREVADQPAAKPKPKAKADPKPKAAEPAGPPPKPKPKPDDGLDGLGPR